MTLTPKRVVRRKSRKKSARRRPPAPAVGIHKTANGQSPQKQLEARRASPGRKNRVRLTQMDEWMSEAFTKMGAPELIGTVPWNWNPRFTRAMGRAKGKYNLLGGISPAKMEFSPSLFRAATLQERRQTVYHECAHIVDYHNGTYRSESAHGYSWQRLMRKAGVPAKRCHNVQSPESNRNKFPAKCLCSTHMISKTRRNRMLHGTKYRCNKCSSHIALVKR